LKEKKLKLLIILIILRLHFALQLVVFQFLVKTKDLRGKDSFTPPNKQKSFIPERISISTNFLTLNLEVVDLLLLQMVLFKKK